MRAGAPLALLLLAACAGDPPKPAEQLDFLAGDWGHDEGGVTVLERWHALPDGDLLGAGSVSRDGLMFSAETMAIVVDGGALAFVTWPTKDAPTVYREAERTRTSVTFANDAVPFPRRITYRRADADTLDASATGLAADGSERKEAWQLRRQPATGR